MDKLNHHFAARALSHLAEPVDAEYCVTLCDLGIFVDKAAEPVPGPASQVPGMVWVGGLRGRQCVLALLPGPADIRELFRFIIGCDEL